MMMTGGMMPPGLFDMMQFLGRGGPHGGIPGDAVYSQEGLDRIITQLMEQHQTGNAPGPASDSAIEALPRRSIGPDDQSPSSGDKAECSICMDEVPLGHQVTVLPCSHWFHHQCVRAWLAEHDTCPHCRQGIMPKDPAGDRPDQEQTATSTTPRGPDEEPLNDMSRSPPPASRGPRGAFPGVGLGPSALAGEGSSSPNDGSSRRGRSSRGNSAASGMLNRVREAFGGSGSPGDQESRRGR